MMGRPNFKIHRRSVSIKTKRIFYYIFVICICIFLQIGITYPSLVDVIKPAKQDESLTKRLKDDIRMSTVLDPTKIFISKEYGRIREVFKGNKDKLIIAIQDAHCNFEAQTNISRILDSLVKNNGLSFVFLEGSSGVIDPLLFTTFPDEEIRKEVATYFMKKGKINGAEFLAITSDTPPQLYGVETKEYYLANLNAFTKTLEGRKKVKPACLSVKNALQRLKGYIYSRSLKQLDFKSLSYKDDKIDFVEYCKFLKSFSNKIGVRFTSNYPNLLLLYSAIDLEQTINFKKVEDERTQLIKRLERVLNDKELSELVSKSVSFKSGRISPADYHTHLRDISFNKGMDFKRYPNLSLYIEYLIVYDKIETISLLKEISSFEDYLKERLFENDAQRELDRLSRHIRILEDMFDISMSKDDVEYYRRHRNEFKSKRFIDFIRTQSKRYGLGLKIDQNFGLVDKYIPDLENFYRIADIRDKAIIENTLKKMEEQDLNFVALITGGYHTEGITQRLREQGISYVVISPKITKVEETPYLKILSNDARLSASSNQNK